MKTSLAPQLDPIDQARRHAEARQRPMGVLGVAASLYRSSVGRKWTMALSGIALIGFVIAHLIGTLKIFLGPEETDKYGEALRDLGGDLIPHGHLLWLLRIGLLLAFAVHLHAAFSLDRRNRAARASIDPSRRDYLAAGYASRSMLLSGITVALFIIFHLADLTWGATSTEFVTGDVYANQIRSFSNPLISSIYLGGVASLSVHLFHGFWSMFQSIGLSHPAVTVERRRQAAVVAAGVIGLGYASIPVAVLVGILEAA